MKKRNSLILAAVFSIAAISVLSCLLWTDMVSLIDYPIRDKNNEMVRGEQVALESPVKHSNPLVINIEMPEVSRDNLLAIINVSEKIKTFFADRGIEIDIASLATITDYRGETLDKFISVSKVTDPDFNPGIWFWQNAYRLTLEKSFLGKTKDYYYSSVILFPEQGANEIEVAKTFLLFKAGWSDYQLNWWKDVDSWNWKNIERYVRLNFYPEVELDKSFNRFKIKDESGKTISVDADINLVPYGWTFHRLEIDAMARAGAYGSLGLATLALILFSFAALGTWRKVLACLAVIGLAFLYAKGSIGLISMFILLVNSYASEISWLTWLVNDFFQHSFEDVFTIEAYFAILISGISFPWHYMRKFNRERMKYSHAEDYWLCWDKAKEKVRITALIKNIAVFDFLLSLSVANYHGARAMWQVGLVAAIGILAAWMLTHYALPIFYRLAGLKDSHKSSQSQQHFALERKIRTFVSWSISNWSIKRLTAVFALVLIIGAVYGAMMLTPVYLKTDNDLSLFLKNSPSERIYDEMNETGGSGSTMFTPFISLDLYDAGTLDELRLYLEDVAKESRMTYSPLYFFMEVMEEDYGYQPGTSVEGKLREEAVLNLEDYGEEVSNESLEGETREIVKSIWGSIMDEDDGLMDHFISFPGTTKSGHIETIVTSAENSTSNLINFRDNTLKGSAEELGELKVHMAGKLSQYLEIDQIISNGRWTYNILSQLAVVLFCTIYFLWQSGKSNMSKWRMSPIFSGVLVAVPFVWATAVLYLIMMVIDMPFDIASASIGAMAVAIAVDFPLFVADYFRRVISRIDATRKEVFQKTLEDSEMVDSIVDVIVDYMGNAILFAFMMVTPIEAIRRLGILEEAVLFSCIFSTVFMVIPMMRWTIRRNRDTSIFRELFGSILNGKQYGSLGRNHAISASG